MRRIRLREKVRGTSAMGCEHISRFNMLEVALTYGSIDWKDKDVMTRRILIVDDNQANITHVADFLRFKKFEVEVAYDGEQAIEKALECGPDVILMDIQMPGISGFEAIKLLRSNSATAAIKVIAVTARATQRDKEACLQAGADGYLSKPFKLAMLDQKLAEMLAIASD